MARHKIFRPLKRSTKNLLTNFSSSSDKSKHDDLVKSFLTLGFMIILTSTMFTVLLMSSSHRYVRQYKIASKLKELTEGGFIVCYQCDVCDEDIQILRQCPSGEAMCANMTNPIKDELKMYCSINDFNIGCRTEEDKVICICNQSGCNGPRVFERNIESTELNSNYTNGTLLGYIDEHVFKHVSSELGSSLKSLLFHHIPFIMGYNGSGQFNQSDVQKWSKLRLRRKQLWDHVLKNWDDELGLAPVLLSVSQSLNGSQGYQNTSKHKDRWVESESKQKYQYDTHRKGSKLIRGESEFQSLRLDSTFKNRIFCKKIIHIFVEKNLFNALHKKYKTCIDSKIRGDRNMLLRGLKRFNDEHKSRRLMKRQIQEDGYMIIVNRDRSSDYIVPQNEHSDKDGENLLMPERGRRHYFIVPRLYNFGQSKYLRSHGGNGFVVLSIIFAQFFKQ